MKYKAVLFDLDGTLLDTLEDLADAANRVLRSANFPDHSLDSYRYFVGDGIRTFIERVLPENQREPAVIARTLDAFVQDYGENWKVKSRIYDGIDVLLNGLQEADCKLAILSNKPDLFTRACAAELLSDWEFYPLFGQREGVPKKPDPAAALEIARLLRLTPETILYLGDTAVDMQTARAAGMCPVGALWGFRTEQELRDAGAQHLAGRPQDVLDMLF